jgi:hypothetical protein
MLKFKLDKIIININNLTLTKILNIAIVKNLNALNNIALVFKVKVFAEYIANVLNAKI